MLFSLKSKIEKNLSDHTEFKKVKAEFEEWIKKTRGSIQDCLGDGDLPWIEDKLVTLKNVTEKMTEGIFPRSKLYSYFHWSKIICINPWLAGEFLWNEVQELFTKASSTTSSTQQVSLRDTVNDLRNDWNLLNNELNSAKGHLDVAKNRWEGYRLSLETFKTDLNKIREKLDQKFIVKGELSELKSYLEK